MKFQPPFQEHSNNKGSALLVSIVFLALLVITAVLFYKITQKAHISATSQIRETRARFLASSGLEYAIGQIETILKNGANPDTPYSAALGENAPYFYGKPQISSSRPLRQTEVPLEHSYFNSFSYNPEHPEADQNGNLSTYIRGIGTNTVEDQTGKDQNKFLSESRKKEYTRRFGYAGKLPPSLPDGQDMYSLQVEDLSSKIYVNGPERYPNNPSNYELARNQFQLLQNLGRILFENGTISFTDLGRRINRARNELESDIQTIGALTKTKPFKKYKEEISVLKHYLTAHTWEDPTTLDPRALKHPRPNDPNLILDYSFLFSRKPSKQSVQEAFGYYETDRVVSADNGRGKRKGNIWESDTTEDSEQSVQKIPKIPGRKLQPRAPINLNGASESVITANLMNIEAQFLDRFHSVPAGKKDPEKPTTLVGKGYRSFQRVRVEPPLARTLADRLIKRRRELVQKRGYGFSTFEELNQFLYALDSSDELTALEYGSEIQPIQNWGSTVTSSTEKLALQQAIIANVNPQSRLPHVNPNFSMGIRYGDVSKADLGESGNFVGWTTEFCFSPTGYFRITSLGRVLGPSKSGKGKKLLSRKKIHSIIKIFDTWKLSTQEEFYRNRSFSGNNEKTTASKEVQYYPENLRDIAEADYQNLTKRQAAKNLGWLDGYLMLPTKDWNKQGFSSPEESRFVFNSGEKSISNGARGPFEYGTGSVNPLVGVNPGGKGNGSSEFLNDGFFAHNSRRYGNGYRQVLEYGAGKWNNGIDDYLRIEDLGSLFTHQKGGVLAWIKPTYFPGEFASQVKLDTKRNPAAAGTRTIFSFGKGQLACENWIKTKNGTYKLQNNGVQSASPRRAALFLRKEGRQLRLWGLHKTRLYNAWYSPRNTGSPSKSFVPTPPLQNPTQHQKQYGSCKDQKKGVPRHPLPDDMAPYHRDIQFDPRDIRMSGGGYKSAQQTIQHPSFNQKDPYIHNFSPGDPGYDSRSWAYPGRWHLVGLFWNDQRAWVYMDGKRSPESIGVDHGVPWKFPDHWSFFVGSNRFETSKTNGFPLIADATIDDIRIWNKEVPEPLFPPPPMFDRYVPEARYSGKIGPRRENDPALTKPMSYDGSIINVSWTAHLPKRNTVDTFLQVKVNNSSWIKDPKNSKYSKTKLTSSHSGRGLPVYSNSGKASSRFTFQQGDQLRLDIKLGAQRKGWIVETPVLSSITVRTKKQGKVDYIYLSK